MNNADPLGSTLPLIIFHFPTGSDLFYWIISLLILLLLILASALISASENGLFSLQPKDLEALETDDHKSSKHILQVLRNPKKLLATNLISVNFVNVGIVVLSSFILNRVLDFEGNESVEFMVKVVGITFLIVFLGEVLPKVYTIRNPLQVARLMALPMIVLSKLFAPLVWLLVRSTSVIDKRITRKGHVFSVDELNHAIDITSDEQTPGEEKNILKSIVNFGNITVPEIMRPRVDVVAVDADLNFSELVQLIQREGYSRMPVYKESFDQMLGILYIKDIIPHLDKDSHFEWQSLLRPAYYVPESKMIDDLLREFKQKRVHMAIVVDEYGGKSGIVTMEDVLEQIFGEIRDEFDEEEAVYSKLDDNTYVFEAKTPINDMCRLMELDVTLFEDIRGEAETIGGLLLELNGKLPRQGQEFSFSQLRFMVEAVDKRKVKRVKVAIQPLQETAQNEN